MTATRTLRIGTRAEIDVDGTRIPLVLLKTGRTIMAIGGVCTHWGGLLAEGKLIDGDCVECPLHGSQFSMVDGSVRVISRSISPVTWWYLNTPNGGEVISGDW